MSGEMTAERWIPAARDANELLRVCKSRSVGKSLPVDPQSPTTVHTGRPFFLKRDSSGMDKYYFLSSFRQPRLWWLQQLENLCEDMNGAPPPGIRTRTFLFCWSSRGPPPWRRRQNIHVTSGDRMCASLNSALVFSFLSKLMEAYATTLASRQEIWKKEKKLAGCLNSIMKNWIYQINWFEKKMNNGNKSFLGLRDGVEMTINTPLMDPSSLGARVWYWLSHVWWHKRRSWWATSDKVSTFHLEGRKGLLFVFLSPTKKKKSCPISFYYSTEKKRLRVSIR